MTINLNDIFNLNGSVIYNPDGFKTIYKVSIDSRTIKKNALYVAIKGKSLDGHDFVEDAVSKGASAVLINQKYLNRSKKLKCTVITVPDSLKAYGELANVFREKFGGKVISITGSNGKTTTKEMLSIILSEKYKTEKTFANDNNQIGIPKTILATKRTTEFLILEHGTNHFGEIEYTSRIANPDYSLITNITDSHLKYLSDLEGVYKEKSALFETTLKNDGIIFVNSDDKIIKSNTKKNTTKITYGFKGNPDFKGNIVGYNELGQPKISVEYLNKKNGFQLPLYGEANAKNALAAIAVAIKLGVPVNKIKSGIKKLKQVKGRLFVEQFPKAIIIDDTYNANPNSMKSAFELLSKIKVHKIKTVILGDMLELGENEIELHKELASAIIKNKIKNVLLIGKLMKQLEKKLLEKNVSVKHFSRRNQLQKFIKGQSFENQIVLVKGSRGMKMEIFYEQIRSKVK